MPQPGADNNRHISQSSAAGESKVRVLAGSVSGENLFPDSEMAPSPCVLTWRRARGRSLLINAPVPPKRAPPYSDPNTTTLVITFQHLNLRGQTFRPQWPAVRGASVASSSWSLGCYCTHTDITPSSNLTIRLPHHSCLLWVSSPATGET
jgi:hypothetical protein